MAVTPFLKPITTRKGIIYTFQSANDDLTLTFNNSVNKARFSYYALLNIPLIGPPSALYDNTITPNNSIQWLAQGETPLIEGLATDQNVNLAQSFQNYALNLEAQLLSMPTADRTQKLKVNERVFWKWLKELGAIQWRDASALEENAANLTPGEQLFTELTENATIYNRVVKYIGEIDVVNNVKTQTDAYSEIYIYVPSNVGSTPYVLFESVSDINYSPGMVITNTPDQPLDIDYLSGRQYSDINQYGLSTLAFYDLTDGSTSSQIAPMPTSYSNPPVYTSGTWFNQDIKYSYYTDATFANATNQIILKTFETETVNFVRSTLDGVQIDWDLTDYMLATEDPTIQTFTAFNDYIGNQNFEFNAILVYYDVYDPNNPTDYKTNLYGVMFLNQIGQTGLEYQIPVITKNMPDIVTKINGNAWAHKLNIKTDNSIEDTGVEKSVNDYLTFSMDLYLDVLNAFTELQVSFNDKLLELTSLGQNLQTAQESLLNTSQYNTLAARMAAIETSLQSNLTYFSNANAFQQQLNALSSNLDTFMQGNAGVTVSYDSNIIKSGSGIQIVRKPNRVTINNSNQNYNISSSSIYDIENFTTLPLQNFTNYYRHENGGNAYALNTNLVLRIDDTIVPWVPGQSVDLVFSDQVNLNGYNLTIMTDANNITGNGVFGLQIASLSGIDFGTLMTPIFRITCITTTSNSLTYRVDKLR